MYKAWFRTESRTIIQILQQEKILIPGEMCFILETNLSVASVVCQADPGTPRRKCEPLVAGKRDSFPYFPPLMPPDMNAEK